MPERPAGSERRPDADRGREPAAVVLYGRAGCHLCDEARELLVALGVAELREIDIERDNGLLARYLERIPVVEVDGAIVSELEPDRNAISRALGTFER